MTTYMQMRGPCTAYIMQPDLLKIRGLLLHKAFASTRCSSHLLLVQTGRYHVPQLQSKDSTCRICKSTSAVEDEQHSLLHCPGFAELRFAHLLCHLFAQL